MKMKTRVSIWMLEDLMNMKTRVSSWMLDNMVNMMTLTTKSPGDSTTKLLGWKPETKSLGDSTAKLLGWNVMTFTDSSLQEAQTVKLAGDGNPDDFHNQVSMGDPAVKWLGWKPRAQSPGDPAVK